MSSVRDASYWRLQRVTCRAMYSPCRPKSASPTVSGSIGVQRRDHAVELVVHPPAFRGSDTGQRRVPEHPSLDELHQVERGADHRVVLAQRVDARDGHVAGRERRHHTVLSVDGVRRRHQRPARLAAQHVAVAAARDEIGRVRLPALERA